MANKPTTNALATVSMDEFIRTRDSVVTGLTKLNGAITTLISAYVSHTNQLLTSSGQPPQAVDHSLTDYLAGSGLEGPNLNAAAGPASKEKKKRPKKEKDPNAPKRPLTAFFLFSTRARDHIKSDLGENATPVEINNEILRRWNDMDTAQKDRWKEIYTQNYDQYKRDVEAYRISSGQDLAVEPVAADHGAPSDPAALNAVPGAVASEDSSDEESSEEEPEPPKAPTPPPPKKTKAAPKGKKKAAEAPAPPAPASPSPSAQLQAPARSTTAIPLPTLPGSEKRKKPAKEEAASQEQPKKKKSRKSEATAAAPTPVPAPAPAPAATPAEKKKKKTKKGDA